MKTQIAEYFRSKAGWRQTTADRLRDGSQGQLKNLLYAESLEELADYVESLPDDDPIFAQLEFAQLETVLEHDDLHTFTIHCDYKNGGMRDWLELWVNSANEHE